MSKFVSKVGHFLSPSADKHPLPCSLTNLEKRRPLNGGYGTDTSSVTSFLLAILSSSNAKYPKYSRCPEAPEEAVCSGNVSATLGSWELDDHNKEQDPDMCCKSSCESMQESKHEGEGNDTINISSQLHTLKEHASHVPLQSTSITSSKRPPSSDESSLLSEDFRAFISLALPTIAKDRHWIMLYSTAKHGTSMRTLYQKSSVLSEPFLLVIGDLEGATFGGLATAPLRPTAQRKYSGTSDAFVFTNAHNDPRLFKSTEVSTQLVQYSGIMVVIIRGEDTVRYGANRYYLLCTNDAISFGGGGHFALHLDDTLLTGSSGACDTFGNDCLATSLDFSVSNVEVWGFSHAIRHA